MTQFPILDVDFLLLRLFVFLVQWTIVVVSTRNGTISGESRAGDKPSLALPSYCSLVWKGTVRILYRILIIPLNPLPLIKNAANFTHICIFAFEGEFVLRATWLVNYFWRKITENCLIGLFPADLQCCWLAAENAVIKPDSLQLCVVFPVLLRQYRTELTYENVCD